MAGVLSFICDNVCQMKLANFLSGQACFHDEMMLFRHLVFYVFSCMKVITSGEVHILA